MSPGAVPPPPVPPEGWTLVAYRVGRPAAVLSPARVPAGDGPVVAVAWWVDAADGCPPGRERLTATYTPGSGWSDWVADPPAGAVWFAAAPRRQYRKAVGHQAPTTYFGDQAPTGD